MDGLQRNYMPDFVAVIRDREDPEDVLNLIIEVTGAKTKDKEAKVHTAKELWVPSVNNHGKLGRWGFIEISDPWDAKNLLYAYLGSGVRS